MSNFLLILVCLVSGLAAYGFCLKAQSIGGMLKVIDYPDVAGGRKRHQAPTPLIGGFAVLIATAMTAPLFIAFMQLSVLQSKQVSIITFVTAVFALLGFIDDRHELSPKIRLLVLVLLVAAVLTNEPALTISFLHFSFLPHAYILGDWGIIFTMLSIVGLSNAVNMADGKNGLVVALCILWAATLCFIGAPVLLPILAALLCALMVAFVFNMRGQLFLGDAGSFGLSALLGLATIYSYTQNFVSVPADLVVLMFLVPVADCLRLMVTRVLRGKSPFSAGRDHLHHYLAMYFGWKAGLPVYLGLVGFPLLIALTMRDLSWIALCGQFLGYCGIIALCILSVRGQEAEAAL